MPTICNIHGTSIIFTSTAPVLEDFKQKNNPKTLQELYDQLPDSLSWPLQNNEGWNNLPGILTAIKKGTLIGVMDRSFKDKHVKFLLINLKRCILAISG